MAEQIRYPRVVGRVPPGETLAEPASELRVCPRCELETEARTCPKDGAPTFAQTIEEPSVEESPLGTLLSDRWRLDRLIGRGGAGVVFAAHDVVLGREVAVKMLRLGRVTRASLRRFFREAELMSRLTHPHILPVLDFGVDAETRVPFLIMPVVRGGNLVDLSRSDAAGIDQREACSITAALAEALAVVHENGLVHRDLKPENVLVETLPGGRRHAWLTDFGIAKLLEEDPATITAAGIVVGTPAYAAPEQTRGDAVDARTDLYGLGGILEFLLAGRAGSKRLARLREKLLAKSIADRPASALVVAAELHAIARSRSSGRGWIAAGLAVIAVLLVYLAFRPEVAPVATNIVVVEPTPAKTATVAEPVVVEPEVAPPPKETKKIAVPRRDAGIAAADAAEPPDAADREIEIW